MIGGYDHVGNLLFKISDDIHLPLSANGGNGYPGRHAPGVIAGDLDGDGEQEIAYVTFSGRVKVRNARTGALEKSYRFPNVCGKRPKGKSCDENCGV